MLDNWLEAGRESARLKTEERSPVSRLASGGGREGSPGGKGYPGGAIRGLKKAINGLKL